MHILTTHIRVCSWVPSKKVHSQSGNENALRIKRGTPIGAIARDVEKFVLAFFAFQPPKSREFGHPPYDIYKPLVRGKH
jgi:hypothetical protein